MIRRLISKAAKLFLVLLVVPAVVTAADPAVEEQALAASKAWLSVVDAGDYASSWGKAADYFQNSVAKDAWMTQLTQHRAPFGKVVSRELKAKTSLSELPNAPKGSYVIIDYVTTFENQNKVYERVTPMLEKDGSWRVSGYFISPSAFN